MSNHFIQETQIPAEYHGQRVDVVLAQLFTDFSRSQLTTWLKAGSITINQKCYKPKDKIQGGEIVSLNVIASTHQGICMAENIPLDIVFEDDELLVINKPAGLIVHPGAGNPQHTLVNALLYHDPSLNHLPRAGIVHRLDKDTTGLLLIAKTLPTYTSLIKQMQAREIQRRYIALVQGHIIAGGTIDTCYGRHPRNRLKMAVCTQGKQAITHYTINKHYNHFSLLDVQLMTGRTHQIRVHMAHIYHPIVGDPLYNGKTNYPASVPADLQKLLKTFKRQALHACSLSFLHPKSLQTLTFTAALPDDFTALLTLMDEHLA